MNKINPKFPQVVRDLLGAKQVMQERGHTKHQLVSETGRVCLNGALGVATGEMTLPWGRVPWCEWKGDGERVSAAGSFVREIIDYSPIAWNNERARTQAEVEQMFDDAASLALSEAAHTGL